MQNKLVTPHSVKSLSLQNVRKEYPEFNFRSSTHNNKLLTSWVILYWDIWISLFLPNTLFQHY